MSNPIKHPLSDFAKFHIEFMGYDFYDNDKKRKVPKFVLWATKQQLCRTMLRRGESIKRYGLIERKGWYKGIRI